MSNTLIPIAHAALSLTESAYLKHYRRGKFQLRDGVAYTASELPGPGFNFAACLGRCPPLAAVLPVAREFFADADKGWGILVEGDAGHPIEAAVQVAGWQVAEDEPAFVLPDLRTVSNPTTRPDGLVLRPVRTRADTITFTEVCTIAFQAPPELATLIMPSDAFARDPAMHWLIGEYDGRSVAAGGYYRTGDLAVICAVATLVEYRGRGIGSALVRACLVDAANKGCTAAALRSGPNSVPLYERLGFRYACQHRTYAAPMS